MLDLRASLLIGRTSVVSSPPNQTGGPPEGGILHESPEDGRAISRCWVAALVNLVDEPARLAKIARAGGLLGETSLSGRVI